MHNRILIVDDVEINQELAKMIVVSKGFVVDIASNGEEAVEAVSRNEYDLVFMDIHMPVMDGIEATKAIRTLPDQQKSAIPIVALTANVGLSQADYKEIGFNESL
jgi:CheY-like chemotaxis protein